MGQPAARKNDPVVGIDIHIVMVPAAPACREVILVMTGTPFLLCLVSMACRGRVGPRFMMTRQRKIRSLTATIGPPVIAVQHPWPT